jgi:hypothetical protein
MESAPTDGREVVVLHHINVWTAGATEPSDGLQAAIGSYRNGKWYSDDRQCGGDTEAGQLEGWWPIPEIH